MAVRRQRATTSETYALDKDYDKVLTKGKKIHRYDGRFYIGKLSIYDTYYSLSVRDYDTNNKYRDDPTIECYEFQGKRWVKIEVV